MPTTIHFSSFPKTEPPPLFASSIADVFTRHEQEIATLLRKDALNSNEVLASLRNDLVNIGFEVEGGKRREVKIERPVFFGENGQPTLKYQIDAYNINWRCGLEVEAGRAWIGNAIYRDLIQGLVMVQIDSLILAVPNAYRYKTGNREVASQDYANTVNVAETLFGHTRIQMPYTLVVISY